MTKLDVEIRINKPKDLVWQMIFDNEHLSNWMPTHIPKSTNDFPSVGRISTSDVYRLHRGEVSTVAKYLTSSEVVAYEEGHSMTTKLIEGLGTMKSMLRKMTLIFDEPNVTKVVMEIDYQMKGGIIGKLLGSVLAKSEIRREITENLSNLKHYAETGQSIPKPGWMLRSAVYKDSINE